MSFLKVTTFKIGTDDFKIISANELEKTASVQIPDGFKYDSDYLYLKVKAVSAGEYWGENKNNDYFPENELKENYKTFLVAHTFKNHENKKIEGAIGDVLSAEWNDKMKAVYLVIRIDKKVAPSIVRGYEKGFMTDVSMGCRVSHVVCSYCGKEAKTRFDYCDHLKNMKGKVMDNGKKVYEINIAPKFHDISAVLNGAERTAKVEGLLINGDKVAYELNKNGISLSEKTANQMFNSGNILKIASDDSKAINIKDDKAKSAASSLKHKLEPKINITKTIDKAKQDINSKVVNRSLDEVTKKSLTALNDISDLIKLKYTKYMSKDECIVIANKLKNIAKKNSLSNKEILGQFLNVIKYALIELTPAEINDITFELLGRDSIDFRNLKINEINGYSSSMKLLDSGDSNVRGCINIIDKLKDSLCGFNGADNPTSKLKIMIRSSRDNNFSDHAEHEIMDQVIKGILPERSAHRKFMIPRLMRISSGEVAEMNSNNHFATPKLTIIKKVNENSLQGILSALLLSAHMKDKEKSLMDGSICNGLIKFAHIFEDDEFEKIARVKKIVKPGKLALTGIPLTFAYSALQRARINNGENISSANRFVAENPTSASMLGYMGAKGLAPVINKSIPTVKKGISGSLIKAKDLFKDTSLTEFIKAKKHASNEEIGILKMAIALDEMGYEDRRNELLSKNGLNFGNIDEYLKIATAYYTIELEKEASGFVKNVMTGIGGDFLLSNVKNGSNLASLPGYVADGLIFAGIGTGLKKLTQKNNLKKNNSENSLNSPNNNFNNNLNNSNNNLN